MFSRSNALENGAGQIIGLVIPIIASILHWKQNVGWKWGTIALSTPFVFQYLVFLLMDILDNNATSDRIHISKIWNQIGKIE